MNNEIKVTVVEVITPPFFAFTRWYVGVRYITSDNSIGTIELPHDSYESALKTVEGSNFILTVEPKQ
ncbi:MAG: hypothetical protein E6R13_04005 [Spirochaetes bacterium]|nr:MAG: hypothetical protein E6R13_04005 [Spirochaetota bacterium]